MLKHPDRFQEREITKQLPDPVQLNSKSLNEARVLARYGMTAIVNETKRLVAEPQLSNFDEHGKERPLPYKFPGELATRLPVSSAFPSQQT